MAIKCGGKVYFGRGGMFGVCEVPKGVQQAKRVPLVKRPQVYTGGGVSARAVLASAGIAGGGAVRVSAKPSPMPKDAEAKGMTERERAAAKYFEAVEAAVFRADGERLGADGEKMPDAEEAKEAASAEAIPEAAGAAPTEPEEPKVEEAADLPRGDAAGEPTRGRRKRRAGKRSRQMPRAEATEGKREDEQVAADGAGEPAAE